MNEQWLAPWRLWWLLGVAALAIAYVAVQFRRRTYAVRFSNLELLEKVAPRSPGWRRHVVAAGHLVALTLLVVAVAQPVGTVRVAKDRSTIILAIDTSLSMEAEDVVPNRIESAKAAAVDFVERVPENLQIGLVSFNRSVTLEVNPTTDHGSVTRAIERLELGEGTAIIDAVTTSLRAIESLPPDEDGERPPATIVLLSDGENTYPTGTDGLPLPTEDAIAPAEEAGIAVSTIAYGTPEGFIMADADGDGIDERIDVEVNRQALANLAEGTGGTAFQADSAAALTQVYEQLGESVGYEEEQRELTWKFVAWALAAFALAGVGSLLWFQRLP